MGKIWLHNDWYLQSYWAYGWILIYSAYIPGAAGCWYRKNNIFGSMIDIYLPIWEIKEPCQIYFWARFDYIMIDICRVIGPMAGFWYIVHIYLAQQAGGAEKSYLRKCDRYIPALLGNQRTMSDKVVNKIWLHNDWYLQSYWAGNRWQSIRCWTYLLYIVDKVPFRAKGIFSQTCAPSSFWFCFSSSKATSDLYKWALSFHNVKLCIAFFWQCSATIYSFQIQSTIHSGTSKCCLWCAEIHVHPQCPTKYG